MDWLFYENRAASLGYKSICGVDEAGRGPLAGPVCAAAVILPQGMIIDGVNDSKKLTEKKRDELYDVITEKAAAYSVGWASVEEIEKINILNAAMLAMKRAVEGLKTSPDYALIDGNKTPELDISCEAIVKGDAKSMSVAAASIIAKVTRDRLMTEYAKEYPQYGFEKHKGYGTKLHNEAILKYGELHIHRKSFLKKLYEKQAANERGKQGEEYVCEYLLKNGYNITERNYSSKYGEVDIIAENEKYIVFVEVKTRKENPIVSGLESITPSKLKKFIRTAVTYLQKNDVKKQPRLDCAQVLVDDKSGRVIDLTYIENAVENWEEYL